MPEYKPFSLASLGLVSPKTIAEPTMNLLNTSQQYPKEVQAAAIALLFKIVCMKYDVKPFDLLGHATNILNDVRSLNPEINGALKYIEHQFGETT